MDLSRAGEVILPFITTMIDEANLVLLCSVKWTLSLKHALGFSILFFLVQSYFWSIEPVEERIFQPKCHKFCYDDFAERPIFISRRYTRNFNVKDLP